MIMSWRERIEVIFSQQNDAFQPLPMWSEVPTQPDTPWDQERWERDNNIRRFWSARLNGGYTQTDIVISDIPRTYHCFRDGRYDFTSDYNDDYASESWFNEGYQGLAEECAPRNIKVDVWKEEDFSLTMLFEVN